MPNKKLKKEKLKKEQVDFVKGYLQTGNKGKAALMAGYKDPTYGYYLAKQEPVKRLILQKMEEFGITEAFLAKRLKEGLGAYIKKGDGIKDPDFGMRHKYFDSAIRIRGDHAPEKIEVEQTKLIINFTPEFITGLRDAKKITDEEYEIIEAEVISIDEEEK